MTENSPQMLDIMFAARATRHCASARLQKASRRETHSLLFSPRASREEQRPHLDGAALPPQRDQIADAVAECLPAKVPGTAWIQYGVQYGYSMGTV